MLSRLGREVLGDSLITKDDLDPLLRGGSADGDGGDDGDGNGAVDDAVVATGDLTSVERKEPTGLCTTLSDAAFVCLLRLLPLPMPILRPIPLIPLLPDTRVPETAPRVDVATCPTAPNAVLAPPSAVMAPSPIVESPDHNMSFRRAACSAFKAAVLN